MLLNEKELKILKRFYFKKVLTLQDLEKDCLISVRSLRYLISNINNVLEFLKISKIEKIKKGTYSLKTNSFDEKKLLNIFNSFYTLSKFKRYLFIQISILISKPKTNISSLSKFFDISRVTINNDLKEINKKLESKDIQIINNKGLYFVGDSSQILNYKLYLIECFLKEYDVETNEYIKHLSKKLYDSISEETLMKINLFLNSLIKKNIIKGTDINYYTLLSKIIYQFIEPDQHNLISLPNLSDRKKIKQIKQQLYENGLIDALDNYSIDKIIYTIISYKSFDSQQEYYEDFLNIELLSKQIILSVEATISQKLSNDRMLLDFLVQHINFLIYRIVVDENYKININENYVIKDNLFYKIKESLVIFEKIFQIKIPDKEIFLIRLHFLASMDRMRDELTKTKDVVIITSYGPGSKQILINNLKKNFNINILYISKYYKSLNNSDYIILTTEEIKDLKIEDKLVIKISIFLTNEEKSNLISHGFLINDSRVNLTKLMNIISSNSYIYERDKLIQDLLENFSYILVNDYKESCDKQDVISESNIYFKYKADTLENAIRFSLKLLKDNYIEQSYIDDVIKIFNENNNNIIRYNGIILPHTRDNKNVIKDGISIVTLQKPLKINNSNEYIKIIVSFVIKNDHKLLNVISNTINKVFREDFLQIIDKQNKKEIINYLTK